MSVEKLSLTMGSDVGKNVPFFRLSVPSEFRKGYVAITIGN